jgi:hypothetical protein
VPMWCVAPQEMNEGKSLGARVQSAYRLQCRKTPHATFNFNFLRNKVESLDRRYCVAFKDSGRTGCDYASSGS